MMLLLIVSFGALFLVLTHPSEGAKLAGIDSSLEIKAIPEGSGESLEGCGMSSLSKCYGILPPDGSTPSNLIEEIGQVSDAQKCQMLCKNLYHGTCKWFMFDRTTDDCMLFSGSLNDLQDDCREVGYAREPSHASCDKVFPSSSSDGCYNFREDYCRFDFSLLENLDDIDSLSECQLACEYVSNCSYFLYDNPTKTCKLYTDESSQRICDIIHGTPEPNFNTCIEEGYIPWASHATVSTEQSTATYLPTETASTTTLMPGPTTNGVTTAGPTTQPQTMPQTTQPPATQPPTTQPPTTMAPTTQPQTTIPPTTQPPTTMPPTNQPPTTKPPTTMPPTTQPLTTIAPTTQPPTTNATDSGCESGWNSYGNSCYKVFSESKNWNSAENACIDNSAHLASIHSDEEVDFLSNILNVQSRYFWIGLEWKENVYQWSDGSSFDFNNWNSGEPNGAGSENCAHVYHIPDHGAHDKWNDARCVIDMPYICKKARQDDCTEDLEIKSLSNFLSLPSTTDLISETYCVLDGTKKSGCSGLTSDQSSEGIEIHGGWSSIGSLDVKFATSETLTVSVEYTREDTWNKNCPVDLLKNGEVISSVPAGEGDSKNDRTKTETTIQNGDVLSVREGVDGSICGVHLYKIEIPCAQ